MNLFAKFISQAKKPKGIPGLIFAIIMNFGHSELTNWGLSFLTIKDNDTILDIGCGGGKTINKLARIVNKGKVYGVDYSDISVKLSTRLNIKYINHGIVSIQKASVSSLPFPDNFFDIITAIETYFFWPDLENDMREVLRVLKPNGKLMILSELYKNSKNEKSIDKWARISNTNDFMNFQTKEEFTGLFINARYKGIAVYENNRHRWICGMGSR